MKAGNGAYRGHWTAGDREEIDGTETGAFVDGHGRQR